jgi:hypothetical protein
VVARTTNLNMQFALPFLQTVISELHHSFQSSASLFFLQFSDMGSARVALIRV